MGHQSKRPAPKNCLRCAREKRHGEWSCPLCGCDIYGPRLEGDEGPSPREDPSPLGGLLEGLVDLPPGAVALFSGAKGMGKTTIALMAFQRPWVVTNEMTAAQVRLYARRVGVRTAGISSSVLLMNEETGEISVDLDLGNRRPDELLLDSLTSSGDLVAGLDAVRAHCSTHGARAIVIAQVNAKGTARGGPQQEHAADVILTIEERDGARCVVVEKNRFGSLGSRFFTLTEKGAELPKRHAYYSVEGQAPRYRLVPHPASGARWAGVYKAVEAARAENLDPPIRLPRPPLATAAAESLLYSSGFLQPEDVRARKAFAEANGVPFLEVG